MTDDSQDPKPPAPPAAAPGPVATPGPAAANTPPPAAKPAAAAPAAAPAKPTGPSDAELTRRKFMSWVGIAWMAFTGSMVVMASQLGRFMFPNVLFEPPLVFKVGYPEDYRVGQIDERFKEKFGIWVGRTDKEIYALISVCTHLGCTPNWLAAEEKFKCPCHGSGFYMSGINFEGPAPRPLERAAIALSDDGQIVVDKGRKFQQEKGQWTDPDSFLLL